MLETSKSNQQCIPEMGEYVKGHVDQHPNYLYPVWYPVQIAKNHEYSLAFSPPMKWTLKIWNLLFEELLAYIPVDGLCSPNSFKFKRLNNTSFKKPSFTIVSICSRVSGRCSHTILNKPWDIWTQRKCVLLIFEQLTDTTLKHVSQ